MSARLEQYRQATGLGQFIVDAWRDADKITKANLSLGYELRKGFTPEDVYKGMSLQDKIALDEAIRRDTSYNMPKKVVASLIGFLPQVLNLVQDQEHEIKKEEKFSPEEEQYLKERNLIPLGRGLSFSSYGALGRMKDVSVGSSYREMISAGHTPEVARDVSNVVGNINVALNLLPIPPVLKAIPGKSFLTNQVIMRLKDEVLRNAEIKNLIKKHTLNYIAKASPAVLAGSLTELTNVMGRKVGEMMEEDLDNVTPISLGEMLTRPLIGGVTGGFLASIPLLPGYTLSLLNDLQKGKIKTTLPIKEYIRVEPVKRPDRTSIVKTIIKHGGLAVESAPEGLPAQLLSPISKLTMDDLKMAGFGNVEERLNKELLTINKRFIRKKDRHMIQSFIEEKLGSPLIDTDIKRLSDRIKTTLTSSFDLTKLSREDILNNVGKNVVFFKHQKDIIEYLMKGKSEADNFTFINNVMEKENNLILDGMIQHKVTNMMALGQQHMPLRNTLYSLAEALPDTPLSTAFTNAGLRQKTYYAIDKVIPHNTQYVYSLLKDYYGGKKLRGEEKASLLNELNLMERFAEHRITDYSVQKQVKLEEIIKNILKGNGKPINLKYDLMDKTEFVHSGMWARLVNDLKKTRNIIQAEGLLNLDIAHLMQHIDDTYNNPSSPHMVNIVTPLRRNYDNYLKMKHSILDPFWKEVEKLGLTELDERIVGEYLMHLQGISKARLEASGINPEQPILTVKQKQIADYMLNEFKKLKVPLGSYLKKEYNMDFIERDNYFRLDTDWDKMAETTMDGFTEYLRKKETKEWQAREENARAPLRLDVFNTFRQAVDKMTYAINMGENVNMFRKIINNASYQDKVGTYGTDLMKEWHNILDRNGGVERQYRIPAIDTIVRNVGLALIAGKVMTALVQVTSIFQGATKIGWKIAEGMKDFTTSPEWRKVITEYAPSVKNRFFEDFSVQYLTEHPTTHKIGKVAIAPLKNLDGAIASSVWIGAYKKYMNDHKLTIDPKMIKQEGVDYANWVVNSTQASGFSIDLPLAISAGRFIAPLESSKRNISISKILLQFQTYVSTMYGIKREMLRAGIRGDLKTASQIFMWGAIASLAEATLRDAGKDLVNKSLGIEEKEEDRIKRWMLTYLTDLPFIGHLYATYRYRSTAFPIEKGVETGYGAFQTASGISRLLSGEDSEQAKKSIKLGLVRTAEGLAAFKGLPLGDIPSILKKTIRKDEEKKKVKKIKEYKWTS